MHKDLVFAFEKLIEIIKEDNRCKGGWHFGSVGRGQEDVYSDYDPVFLVADKNFESFAADVPKMMSEISDELLICWAEDFNSGFFKNYCNMIRLGENLHQLDFFILNHDYPNEWWCKHHCKGCTKQNIFFDRNGETAEFLEKGYTTDNYVPDTARAIDTYWFHAMMLVKYFKRSDLFKISKIFNDFLLQSHVNLLLSRYDTMDWGAWETKVKYCVPPEKQERLKTYLVSANIAEFEKAIKKGINLFKDDAEEICKEKGINYSERTGQQVIKYINDNI